MLILSSDSSIAYQYFFDILVQPLAFVCVPYRRQGQSLWVLEPQQLSGRYAQLLWFKCKKLIKKMLLLCSDNNSMLMVYLDSVAGQVQQGLLQLQPL